MENVRRLQPIRLLIYALIVGIFLWIPTAFFEAHPLCPIYRIFGVRCLTCGMTRAFSNLFHLHPLRALAYNPLVLVLFPLFWTFVLTDFVSFVRRRRGKESENLFEFLYKKIFFGKPEE